MLWLRGLTYPVQPWPWSWYSCARQIHQDSQTRRRHRPWGRRYNHHCRSTWIRGMHMEYQGLETGRARTRTRTRAHARTHTHTHTHTETHTYTYNFILILQQATGRDTITVLLTICRRWHPLHNFSVLKECCTYWLQYQIKARISQRSGYQQLASTATSRVAVTASSLQVKITWLTCASRCYATPCTGDITVANDTSLQDVRCIAGEEEASTRCCAGADNSTVLRARERRTALAYHTHAERECRVVTLLLNPVWPS